MGKGLHPDCYIELVIEDSYYNMHEQVIAHPHVVDIARQAMVDCDIEPQMKPIRGGTDGAQLSFMGLPCPNLFTGGYRHFFFPPGQMVNSVWFKAMVQYLLFLFKIRIIQFQNST